MVCSVVIRCFNEAEHLPGLLEGIRRQTVPRVEVIIVDSGSTDSTVAIARKWEARILHISQQDFSFGRALNQGVAAATGDIVVFASAHTYPISNQWLELLLQPLEHSDVALVYGGQHGDHRTKFSERQIFRQWFPEVSCWDQRHPFCNNANAAIRRALWNEMRYDEEMPGLEDIHWAKRALERGYKIVYRHEAAVAHIHQERYGEIYHRYHREAMALRMISPWERIGLRNTVSLMVRAMASDMAEARKQDVLGWTAWSIIRFRAAQYLGAYRGSQWHGRLTGALRTRLYYPRGYRAADGRSMQLTDEDDHLETSSLQVETHVS